MHNISYYRCVRCKHLQWDRSFPLPAVPIRDTSTFDRANHLLILRRTQLGPRCLPRFVQPWFQSIMKPDLPPPNPCTTNWQSSSHPLLCPFQRWSTVIPLTWLVFMASAFVVVKWLVVSVKKVTKATAVTTVKMTALQLPVSIMDPVLMDTWLHIVSALKPSQVIKCLPFDYSIILPILSLVPHIFYISSILGPKCEVEVDACESEPCLNHGLCIDLPVGFQCVCAEGYEGSQCENEIDECQSNPCAHGLCTDLVNSYRCTCDPGFTGEKIIFYHYLLCLLPTLPMTLA